MKKKLAWLFMSVMLIGSICAAVPSETVQAASNAKFVEQEGKAGIVTSYPIDIVYPDRSEHIPHKTFCAGKSAVNYFFDYKGYFNVVQVTGKDDVMIFERYDANMKKVFSFTIANEKYDHYGRTICDDKGNYYVVEGKQNGPGVYGDTLGIYKYDYYGNLIGECHLDAIATSLAPYAEDPLEAVTGAREIFAAGACNLTINDGTLAIHFSQQMYDGHQRSNVVYIDCETMEHKYEKIKLPLYVSHSFDQKIITTSDGNYLAVNHGDGAPYRAFFVSKIDPDGSVITVNDDVLEGNHGLNGIEGIATFHFREGANRDGGYNETYAQLGGIVELDNSYALFASSERTLSLDYAPTNGAYCGHGEARDLFIQYLDKDFLNLRAEDRYVVAGEKRTAVGKHPTQGVGELTQDEDVKDYDVIWLTDYPDEYYAGNPQMIEIENNRLLLLWEKRSYTNKWDKTTYYAIVDANGNIVQHPVMIPGIELTGNTDSVYKDGKLYWVTNEVDDDYYVNLKKDYIHVLDIYATPKNWTLLTDLSPKEEYVYVKPGESISLKDYIQKVPADASTDDFAYVLVNANPGVNSTIDENGLFTMGDAYCTEEIHIYSNENLGIGTMFYIIADAPYETGITLNKTSFYTTMNHSASLSVTGFASELLGDAHVDVRHGELIWTSSDESIATIEAKGSYDRQVRVDFHNLGKVTITVTESRSGVSASCEIEVVSVEEYNKRMQDEYNQAIGGGGSGDSGGGTSGGSGGNSGSTSDTAYTGLVQAEDGNWYLYENGVRNETYGGLYYDMKLDSFWLLENGQVDFNYNGLYNDAVEGWWLIENGTIARDYNGLYYDEYYGWWLVANGGVYDAYYGLWYDETYGWWLIKNGTIAFDYTGLYEDANYGWCYISEGQPEFDYEGLCYDETYGWCLVSGGTIDFDYTGLYCDEIYGWYLISNGIVDKDYTGLYCDANYGWWLIKDGAIAFDYNGLWGDPVYGWWLINEGSVNFGYTGLYGDANYGWWLIGGGAVAFDYNGLWGDPVYGWWLVNGGSVNFGYTGLYGDAAYGWWLIGGGAVAFDYNGLWGDPVYGWWLVNGGSINFGYTGLYYDVNYGWWYIQGGAVGFGYTGEVYYDGVPYYVVNGQLV